MKMKIQDIALSNFADEIKKTQKEDLDSFSRNKRNLKKKFRIEKTKATLP